MGTTGWGYYQQGADQMQEIEELGRALNLKLGCPAHYPAFGKRLFECKCGVLFPVFTVKAAVDTGDWSMILKQHVEGYRPEDKIP